MTPDELALFEAVENNQVSKVKEYLDRGTDPNLRNSEWNWPLLLSASLNFPILKLLIESGADPNVFEENKFYSPLIQASRNGKTEIIEFLLDHGADSHHLSFAGLPALFYTIERNDLENSRVLLSREMDRDFLKECITLFREKKIPENQYKSLLEERIQALDSAKSP
ncbi:MAG: ankyrin repeat domain-containing protein [Leptospiraceae bacterium]|nr:ankyrin repeat domain-containing protein [Leptospiraceae bacterium]MCP5511144.1 ankyrin repeat domain-containing protein [Leptospiraceae bacterium]